MPIEKIKGTLVYVQIDKPRPCYVQEKGTEWKSSIVVDEDFADTWDAAYPKQPANQVKTSEFEGVYKIPAPFPDQRKQHVITLRRNTKLGNGEDVPDKYHPQVFEKTDDGLQNITMTKLVANGSKGVISVIHYAGKMGDVARLGNVLVTDMIEYVRAPSTNNNPGSEFGEVAKSQTGQGASSVKAKPVAVVNAESPTEVEDDDIPF